jgi:hypothetical protein
LQFAPESALLDWRLTAPRKSAGSDRGQQVPVGLAGVEQRVDPVVPEGREPERPAAHRFVAHLHGRARVESRNKERSHVDHGQHCPHRGREDQHRLPTQRRPCWHRDRGSSGLLSRRANTRRRTAKDTRRDRTSTGCPVPLLCPCGTQLGLLGRPRSAWLRLLGRCCDLLVAFRGPDGVAL